MKKILIVDCNAKLGGIQKALISYLQQESKNNDVSVLLFYKSGSLLPEIPSNVKVYTTQSDFRYMGMSQKDCIRKEDKIKRGIYVIISKFFSQRIAVAIASKTIKDKIPGCFDEVISFSHMSDNHSFYGGTAQYVLKFQNGIKRICYIHCDYLNSGNRSRYSDKIYSQFDEIVCVSKSTRNVFLCALPQLQDKVVAKYNYIDGERIRKLAGSNPYMYNKEYINAIIVARMTKEKGIERIIKIFDSEIKNRNIRLFIIGDGIEKENIQKIIKEKDLSETIILLGEKENPYCYMINADFLIVPSYHEAAPVIFQEAIELNLPVVTTRTTSADEFIGTKHGIVIDNNDKALEEAIIEVLDNPSRFINRFKNSQSD